MFSLSANLLRFYSSSHIFSLIYAPNFPVAPQHCCAACWHYPLVHKARLLQSAPVEAYTLDLSQGSATTAQVRLLPAELKAGLKTLVLTGTLSSDRNGDFRQIRDLCPNIEVLDLSVATCTEIPDNAFLGHRGLRKVVLPNGVKRIGRQAFFNCKNLQEVVLPSAVEIIEDGAFNGCTALRNSTLLVPHCAT